MRITLPASALTAPLPAPDAWAYGQDGGGRRDALMDAACPALGGKDALDQRSRGWIERAAAACKVWPAHPQSTLLVVPLTETTADEGLTRGDPDVWLVDTADGTPRQHVRLDQAMDGDAIWGYSRTP